MMTQITLGASIAPLNASASLPHRTQRATQRAVPNPISAVLPRASLGHLTPSPSLRQVFAAAAAYPPDDASPVIAAPAKKPRLPALDSLRFFMIAYIAVGHFIGFGSSNPIVVKLFSQVNVVVGAFFVLSGYVAGYTSSDLHAYKASPRVDKPFQYFVGRVAGFYPLYLLSQLLFGAMFVWVDARFNGPLMAAVHGVMTTTLTQAWFPLHAELWNAPTWFLSALTFALLIVPFAMPAIAKMGKKQLRRTLATLTGISLLGKLAYSYDLGAWCAFEGLQSAKTAVNLAVWNITRFHPFYAAVEVLMGVAAVRLVMTDGTARDGAKEGVPAAGAPLLTTMLMCAPLVARATGALAVNDALLRGAWFIPLFTLLLVQLHRQTVAPEQADMSVSKILTWKPLVYLGAVSFPIFILHGPIGQVFFKRMVATKLWGGVLGRQFFPVWMATVLLSSIAVHHLFVQNKAVKEATGKVVKALTADA